MTTTAAPLRIPLRFPRVRWGIGVLLAAGVLVNFSIGSTSPLADHSRSRNSV
jgi:hypothetical protein